MHIEKLVSYTDSLDDVYYQLRYSMVEHGFSLKQEDTDKDNERSFIGTSRSINARVDVRGLCFLERGRTIVQLIYLPSFTPPFSRPSFLNSSQEEALVADLDRNLVEILNATGDWEPVNNETLLVTPDSFTQPDKLSMKSQRSLAGIRLLLWLGVVLIGLGITYYMYLSKRGFGSVEGWAAVIFFSFVLFLLDLYRFIIGKR